MHRIRAERLRRYTERNNEIVELMGLRFGAVLGQPPFPMASTDVYKYPRQIAGLKYHWGVRTAFDRWVEDWQ